MSGPITDFLDAFSSGQEQAAYGNQYLDTSTERFFLSQPFLWKVSIGTSRPGLEELKDAVDTACHKAGESWRALSLPVDYEKNGNLLVAQSIAIPNEATSFGEFGQENRGGFLPGYGITQRESFLSRGLSINFFETKVDIEHTFFRPWLIAIGIDGLINTKLKTTIVVTQYDNKMQRRKGFIFEDAFPTVCEPYNLAYTEADFIVKSVTFGCRNYKPLPI
jgi:hypothetical protein|tara:strand:- start:2192 stop:2851 length:660 start_codon:yes stop_codon:yes gene_type:complete